MRSVVNISLPPSLAPLFRSALLITTVFDRSVNCRRAASVSVQLRIRSKLPSNVNNYLCLLVKLNLFLFSFQAAFQENVGRQVCEAGFLSIPPKTPMKPPMTIFLPPEIRLLAPTCNLGHIPWKLDNSLQEDQSDDTSAPSLPAGLSGRKCLSF